MDRRDLLRGVAAVGAAGTLAGCVSEGDPDDTDDPDDGTGAGAGDGDGDGDDPGGGSPSLVGTDLDANGDCADGDDRDTAAVEFGDGEVTVVGGVGTPNPCYEASLAAPYDADADEARVTVAVTAEDAICQSCLGLVQYEAVLEFDGGLPETVTVRHERDGETTTVTTAER